MDIASQLLKCPTSVMVLHDIEKLAHPSEAPIWGADDNRQQQQRSGARFGSAGGLIALERFFEDATVEVPEVNGVESRKATLVSLLVSFGHVFSSRFTFVSGVLSCAPHVFV